ncbi:MAG: hypothetical protein ACTSSP_09365 [Candidatus Asgardarchaeia archaeon]
MRRLKMTHFLQEPAHCAVASIACVTNYYNPEIDYEYVRDLAYKKIMSEEDLKEQGLDSGQMCLLLNLLGFYKVTLITSDLAVFDYSWANFGRKRLIKTLKDSCNKKEDEEEKETTKNVYKWLKKIDYDNNIKINFDFRKYIQQHLNRRKPVLLSYVWTMFQKFPKDGEDGNYDSINGDWVEHAVAANGYDDKGLWIVDSHHQFYKYKRKKYRKGFYKMSWDNLLTCLGQGDVILPEEYYE